MTAMGWQKHTTRAIVKCGRLVDEKSRAESSSARRWATSGRIPSNREPVEDRFFLAAGFDPGGFLFCASLATRGSHMFVSRVFSAN